MKTLLQEPQFTGLKAYVTGAAAMSLDAKTTSLQDMDNIDKISVVLILVLLCLYFRSVVTPVVPLLATGTGIVICFGILHLLTFALPLFYLILTLVRGDHARRRHRLLCLHAVALRRRAGARPGREGVGHHGRRARGQERGLQRH